MKLRHPSLIRAAGFVGSWAVRLWMGTVRYSYRSIGPNLDPTQPGFPGRYIYAFWHDSLLVPAYYYAKPDIRVLISQHADGQLIAEACRHLRIQAVRGSTTRGGSEALLEMVQLAKRVHLAVTPDGPRGPRHQVQKGVAFLASRTGLPIVPMGIGFQKAWRMNSWDRFALPCPWSWATGVSAPPIRVPAGANKPQLEEYRQRIENAMLWVTELAERWAASGKWPGELAAQHEQSVYVSRSPDTLRACPANAKRKRVG